MNSPPADRIDPRDRLSNSTCLYAAPISPTPICHAFAADSLQVERHEQFVLAAPADTMLVEELVADRPLVAGTMVVVRTASFSGNAFSVTNGLGRFRSPRGHPRSTQNVRT